MPIFKIEKDKLLPIKESKIDLERDLQKVTEDNLDTAFGLKFITSEFALNNLRIDTLAFDEETNSFVIIEFKRDRSFSIIDQGYAYLALMLNNKADFILEYNEKMKNSLKREDIDWSQSKVLFLANSFTTYQQNAINFKDLPIELWEVKKYDNGTILYNQLKATDTKESIKTISKDQTIDKVVREVKNYSIDDHFREGWDESREIFDDIREKLLAIDNRLEESPQKIYIGYKLGRKIVFELKVQKARVVLVLNRVRPSDIDDPKSLTEEVKDAFKFYGKYQSTFNINEPSDIEYGVFLAKQAYEKFNK